jgi:hypothetical protein
VPATPSATAIAPQLSAADWTEIEARLREAGCTEDDLALGRRARIAMDRFFEICSLEAAGIDYADAVRQIIPGSPSIAPDEPSEEPSSRRRQSTIPQSERARAMCLRIQESNLRVVARLRQQQRRVRGEPFVGVVDIIRGWGIAPGVLYETNDVGMRIGLTIEEDEYIGHHALSRRAQTHKQLGRLIRVPPEQYLRRITPGTETPKQTSARRAASKKAERNTRRAENRVAQRARERAEHQYVADLDCRASAIVAAMGTRRWVTVTQLAATLRDSTAFRDVAGTSLRRVIQRDLDKQPLSDMIRVRNLDPVRGGLPPPKAYQLK